MDSDVDLVILCSDPRAYLADLYWIEEFEAMTFLITRNRGPMTELRFRRPTGLEIEFGFAPVSCASIDPTVEGTREIVQDGMAPLLDSKQILARLTRAVTQ